MVAVPAVRQSKLAGTRSGVVNDFGLQGLDGIRSFDRFLHAAVKAIGRTGTKVGMEQRSRRIPATGLGPHSTARHLWAGGLIAAPLERLANAGFA